MAEQGVLLNQDQFCCRICLELLKDPVTLLCGHSYCSGCIEHCWDQDEQMGIYCCPLCRRSFTPRPELMRNNMLAEVVEKLKETGGAQAAAAPSELTSPAGSETELVPCDLCIGTRKQSAMSCLVCLVSYCETHLQPHYQVPGLKKHKLVKATSGLEERICSSHDKLLEVFCRTDQQCICHQCFMEEHKGHDTVSATVARKEKQSALVASGMKTKKKKSRKMANKMKQLQQSVESVKHSGQAAEQDSERIFTELIHSIERRRSEVRELIRAQQGAAVSEAEGLVERLKQETAELGRRHAEMEQLSRTDDIHFLQNYQSVSSPSVPSDNSNFSVSLEYFSDVTKAVSDLREKLEDVIKGEWSHVIKKPNTSWIEVDVPDIWWYPPEPRTRADFLQYSCPLTLDPNTASRKLSLSEENRKATRLNKIHPYPDHPDRFTNVCPQVLCREALSGQCYWEVDWKDKDVIIAVAYKDMGRTCFFGDNPKSWGLRCSRGGYSFTHNYVETEVSGDHSFTVGVFLDHKVGSLSFYSVTGTMNLLHRVQTTFTQPLHAGFAACQTFDCAEITKLEEGGIFKWRGGD